MNSGSCARAEELEDAQAAAPEAPPQADRLRLLFEENEDPILVVSAGVVPTKIVDCNQAAIKSFGYDAGELATIGYEGLVVAEDLAQAPIHQGAEPGEAFSRRRRIQRKDGSETTVQARARRLTGEQSDMVMVVLRDITEKEASEAAIRDRDERLAIFFDHTPDAILVVDDATAAVIDSNVVAQTLFGYSAEEFSGKPYESLGSAGEFESQPLVSPPPEPGGEARIERRFQTNDGRGFLGEARAIHAPSGTTFVIIRDITEERATTRALRDRDARLLVLIEESDDAVLMIDERLNIVEFNKATVELLGFDPDELYNLSYRAIFDAAAWEEFVEQSAQMKDGESVSGLRELIRKDGQVISVDARAKALPDGGSLVVLRDITEKLRLEEQLQQAQRMELIGQLAGGVAHEFNNLLTVINGYAEMMLPLVAENPEALRNVQDIHLAGLNAAKLTEQLLDIGQRQMVASQELNLNAFLEDLADMLRHVIGPDVELSLELGRSVPSVVAGAVQLTPSVVSLAANARDAMPDGGRLLIKTTSGIDSEGRTTALIAVRDNGIGMDEQVQRRVFDPFFTTKDQGQGIGLGLATTYGIVTQAGGSIEVESAPGEGSTFTITLPAAERSPASESS